jgi:hypothetical protein
MSYRENIVRHNFIVTSNLMHEQIQYDRNEEYDYDYDDGMEESTACNGDCLRCGMNCTYN